jgi:hypothetical protein
VGSGLNRRIERCMKMASPRGIDSGLWSMGSVFSNRPDGRRTGSLRAGRCETSAMEVTAVGGDSVEPQRTGSWCWGIGRCPVGPWWRRLQYRAGLNLC